MIVVDTSVWVSALRSAQSPEAHVLQALLDADEAALPEPVRIELLSGASQADRPRLRRALSALPVIYPTDETWRLIDRWIDRARGAADRFRLRNLLIGALAAETGALVWSLEADFARMSQLKLVERHEP